MKCLLIQPTLTTIMYGNSDRPTLYEPLGLAYLAAAVRQAGHEPTILDCYAEGWRNRRPDGELSCIGLSDDEIAARIRQTDPDLVGITCMFTGFDRDCRRIAAIAKRVKPGVPVVAGGADATVQADELVQDPSIDLVVRCEGEQVLPELLDALARDGRLPDDLPGTTTKSSSNRNRPMIEDLDSLPFPARDLVPMHIYHDGQHLDMPYAMRWPIGFMLSSRGCPYRCIFCSTSRYWKTWRPRSPRSVVDEIEEVVNAYGVREIAFLDDSFIVQPERVEAICNEIRKRNLDIAWSVPVGLTVWKVTEDILRAMRDTGFYRACFPIESGDPEILEYMNKPVDLDKVLATIETCHRLGIWTYGNFLIGFPEQTPESVERTARFAETCGLDMINVYIVQPYRGSELYTIMEQMGFLEQHATGSTILHSKYDTKYFKAEELRAKRDEIYRRFTQQRVRRLFTPREWNRMARKMATPEKFAYAMRVFGTFARNSLRSKKFTILQE